MSGFVLSVVVAVSAMAMMLFVFFGRLLSWSSFRGRKPLNPFSFRVREFMSFNYETALI